MKSIYIILFLFCINQILYAQEKGFESIIENAKKEATDNSCKCISEIKDTNRPKQEIIDEISKCIDKNIASLQVADQLNNLNLDEVIKEAINSSKSDTIVTGNENITIDVNEESDTYKKSYFELERELLKNCEYLRELTGSENEESKLSVSRDEKAQGYYSRGVKADKDNNTKAAAKYFKKAVKADPNFAFAWDNLGLMYRKLEKYDKAIDAYNKSLEIDPTGPMPLQNLAVVYAYQKKYQKAIDSFEQLSKYDKDNAEIYYGIGQIQFQYLKEYENSLENMCKAYNLYVQQKSPYRSDAEKIINYISQIMIKDGKESRFNEILEKHNIKPETN